MKTTVQKYVMTNGLLATAENMQKPTMVKICFAIMSDDTVHVTVDSAHTGSTMPKLGKKIITRQQLSDMPEDAYSDMVFNRAAFALMNLSICE